MFALGDAEWPGIAKLAEECGEIVQVVGKLIATRGELKHWNVKDLKVALEDEIADVMAAGAFVVEECNLDAVRVYVRMAEKLALFRKWHASENEPIPE